MPTLARWIARAGRLAAARFIEAPGRGELVTLSQCVTGAARDPELPETPVALSAIEILHNRRAQIGAASKDSHCGHSNHSPIP